MFKKISNFSKIVALVALPFSYASAQQENEATTPLTPEISGRFTLISAHPEKRTAIIKEAGQEFTLDCEQLAHNQERTEQEIIYSSTTSIAFSTKHKREQSLQLELGFGHTTLAEAYQHSADIINGDEHGDFKFAAQYGHERSTLIQAQTEAGCNIPMTYTLVLE